MTSEKKPEETIKITDFDPENPWEAEGDRPDEMKSNHRDFHFHTKVGGDFIESKNKNKNDFIKN